MKAIKRAFILGMVFSGTFVCAEEKDSGRYKIVPIEKSSLTLKIDTKTGETWYLVSTMVEGIERFWWNQVLEHSELVKAIESSKKAEKK